jgi:hypothetical protein
VAKASKELIPEGAATKLPDQPADPAAPNLQSLLHELDSPSFERHAAANGGDEPVANESGPLDADERLLDAQLLVLSESPVPAESAVAADSDPASIVPDEVARSNQLSTRAITHVPESAWFDVTLGILGADDAGVDPKARLAWRFKAVSAANKLLGPLCPSKDDRAELVAQLRKYELSLREQAGPPPQAAKQGMDALHARLSKDAVAQLDRALTKLEDKLLAIDELVSEDAFRMRWNKERETPKVLLRYARLLAARRFNVGFRRDRFEGLAHELLTGKLPSGALVLLPRSKAGPVLHQLLRALPRTASSPADRAAAIGYLRDALDRLENLGAAKQFFDSGFFLDVHGYKVSMHDQITNPEFLFLCVAMNVEIHNRLHSWSSSNALASSAPALGTLQAQLRGQESAVQGVFANFRKPIASSPPVAAPPAAKKPARPKTLRMPAIEGATSTLRVVAAAVLVVVVLTTNLYVSGALRFEEPVISVAAAELHALSPLLVRASMNAKHTRFDGLLSRPAWYRLRPEERRTMAAALAQKLFKLGVRDAVVFAYKTRAIEIHFGTLVYVDDAKSPGLEGRNAK